MPPIQQITRWDYFERVYSKAGRDQRVADLAKNAQIPVETVREKLKANHVYVYRTFLNSVLLASDHRAPEPSKRPSAGRLLILPRYGGAVPGEMERQAEAAHREAYGSEMEIVFVDAETLAFANGSLRCVVCAIPRTEASPPP
jgi:hypothetical protein